MGATSAAQQPWLSPPTATAIIRNDQTGVVSFDVTPDVSAILTGTNPGHGWLIKKVDEGQLGSLQFASRERGPAPRLVLKVDGGPQGGGGPGPLTGSATLLLNADTYVRQLLPNQNLGSEGLLRIQALGRNRALVSVDPAAIAPALRGALVGAHLQLPIARTFGGWGPDRFVGAHRMLRAWGESTATWNCAVDSNTRNISADCSGDTAWTMWSSADEVPWRDPATGTALVSTGQTGTLSLDVTRDVACALAGFAPLHGWMIKKELESQGGQVDFHSREGADPPSLLLSWSDGAGVVVNAQLCGASGPPSGCTPSAAQDLTCNGVDDDCDGRTDDDFIIQPTTCGVGACSASGETGCVAGLVVDTCTPGAPAATDATCDATDDDCDGQRDEDYVPVATACGAGVCASTGSSRCVDGQVQRNCTPLAPLGPDTTCDGRDDDCDEGVDEDYVPIPTSCGVGACAATGMTSCSTGQVQQNCAPGAPIGPDTTCDGVDDDCSGQADETYAPVTTSCGIGACAATGPTRCVDGRVQQTCVPGAPGGDDTSCDGVDDDCDGSADEEFVAGCSGAVLQACMAGVVRDVPCSDDDPCNGAESCVGGACVPGTAPEFDDGNPCTLDSCEPGSGVRHTPAAAGSMCGSGLCGTSRCDESGACVPDGPPPPDDGDPCTIVLCDPVTGGRQLTCPELDRTVTTTVFDSTAWIYSGPNPLQQGVQPGTIELGRAVVLRGKVIDREGLPLSGVRVHVREHSELGFTYTQADGRFDMVVNGGGVVVVAFEHSAYLSAQRVVPTRWNEYAVLDDVTLIAPDPLVTEIDLAQTGAAFQVARGSVSSDVDGQRQATLLFPSGTEAQMVRADGTSEAVTDLSVRLTEFTVGARGFDTMPGPLPFSSGYTYAVEFNADQARTNGAKSIEFNQPLLAYVDNFLGFPAGTVVPVGAYDRDLHQWVAHKSGVVLRLISVGVAGAQIDVTGDGVADTGTALSNLGIGGPELQQLGTLYAPGSSLWRFEVPHFTEPYDCNWPFGPPAGAAPPPSPGPEPDPGPDPDEPGPRPDDPCELDGSIIECETLTLREQVPVPGTTLDLAYSSQRVPDQIEDRRLVLTVSGPTLPGPVKRIQMRVDVAGRRTDYTYAPSPNLRQVFDWDGLDAYGRRLQGRQPVKVALSYVYDGAYGRANRFADYSSAAITGSVTRREIYLTTEYLGQIGTWEVTGLGGWSLTPHHQYDPGSQTLYLGTGERRTAKLEAAVLQQAFHAGPTQEADVRRIGPDGSAYFYQQGMVRRLTPQGTVQTVAGNGQTPAVNTRAGDGGPALQARLGQIGGMALGPDGSLYLADMGVGEGTMIRKVAPDGIITRVAGTGVFGFSGDGGPALLARFGTTVWDIAVDAAGNIYVADSSNRRIRRIDPSALVQTVAGNGVLAGPTQDNVPASSVPAAAEHLDVAPDGTLYATHTGTQVLFAVSPQGLVRRLGRNVGPRYQEGALVTQVSLMTFDQVRATPDGRVFFTAEFARPDGALAFSTFEMDPMYRLRLVTGPGFAQFTRPLQAGAPALGTGVGPKSLAVAPDGTLWMSVGNRVPLSTIMYRLTPVSPSLGLNAFSLVVGEETYFFEQLGRHTETRATYTGALLWRFGYDQGQLTTLTDGDGNVTTIERDAAGRPLAIVAPFGQKTVLSLDGNGFLDRISSPAGDTFVMTNSAGGLIESFTDPRGQATSIEYDALGRLSREIAPDGSQKELLPSGDQSSWIVDFTSGEGLSTTYEMSSTPNGSVRVVTHPDGTTTTTTHSTAEGRSRTVEPDGTVIEVTSAPDPTYGMRRPLGTRRVTLPSGLFSEETLTATYEGTASIDRRTTQRNVNGSLWTMVDDRKNSRRSITSPRGRVVSVVLDAKARPVQISEGGLTPVSYGYDTRGRIASSAQGTRVVQYGYEEFSGPLRGLLRSATNTLGQVRTFTPDAAARLLEEYRHDGSQVLFDWDSNGNLSEVTPPGRPAHGLTYTLLDDLESYATPPVAGLSEPQTYFQYNRDRQLVQRVGPDGKTLDVAYDSAGRVEMLGGPTSSVSYRYYGNTPCPGCAPGALAAVTESGGVDLSFGYDGQLVTLADWSGAVNAGIGWTFDKNFRVSAEKLEAGGTSTTAAFTYDTDGLITCASRTTCTAADALKLTYSTSRPALTSTSVAGVTEAFTYNTVGELASFDALRNGTSFFREVLDTTARPRDALGRVRFRTEVRAGVTRNFEYRYDLLGRLQTVLTNDVTTHTFEYDANDNRLSVSGAVGTLSATYDAQDRLLTHGPWSYTYTANGDLLAKTHSSGDAWSYRYDERGNLVSVQTPSGDRIEYLVDGLNRRVAKRINGTPTQQWLWTDEHRVAAQLDGTGQVVARFLYGTKPITPELAILGTNTYRVIADHLGSVRALVNVNNTSDVPVSLDYDVFGEVTGTGAGLIPHGFAGGFFDPDTGLVRFGARDYDPIAGRWASKDPILFAGGQANLYTYAGNDPINLIDPFGLTAGCDKGCFSSCMDDQGSDYALDALGLSGPFISIPKFGRDLSLARRSSRMSRATNLTSWGARGLKAVGANGAAISLRALGRRLNPYANVVAAGAASYLATSALICSVECAGK